MAKRDLGNGRGSAVGDQHQIRKLGGVFKLRGVGVKRTGVLAVLEKCGFQFCKRGPGAVPAAVRKGYVEGKLALYAKLRVGLHGVKIEKRDFVAIFHGLVGAEENLLLSEDSVWAPLKASSEVVGIGEHAADQELPVLVGIGEDPKGRHRLRVYRSLVRLNGLDELPDSATWFDPEQRALSVFGSSPVLNFMEPFGLGVANGKEGVTPRLASRSLHELPGDVIKPGSQVVQDVADDHAEVGRRRLDDFSVDRVVAGLRLYVNDEVIGARLRPEVLAPYIVERLQVGICPPELGKGSP